MHFHCIALTTVHAYVCCLHFRSLVPLQNKPALVAYNQVQIRTTWTLANSRPNVSARNLFDRCRERGLIVYHSQNQHCLYALLCEAFADSQTGLQRIGAFHEPTNTSDRPSFLGKGVRQYPKLILAPHYLRSAACSATVPRSTSCRAVEL